MCLRSTFPIWTQINSFLHNKVNINPQAGRVMLINQPQTKGHWRSIMGSIIIFWFYTPNKLCFYIYTYMCACVLSHSVMSDSLRPHGLQLPGSSVHGDSPDKNTGVGCQALLQGIFPIQGSNPGLLHGRQILLPSETSGKPYFLRTEVMKKCSK